MSGSLASIVPREIAPLCRSMAIAGTLPVADAADVEADMCAAALARFGASFWQPNVQSVASLWSMYYLHALTVPAVATLLACDRILPVALAEIGLELDAKATPERIWIRDGGCQAGDADAGRRFATLVHGHLVPFVERFADLTGLSPLLLWSNAATIFDYALGAVGGRALAGPRAEAEAVLAGTGPDAVAQLAQPLRTTADGRRERKICCTRHRLSGVSPCPVVCPGRDAYMGMGRGMSGAGVSRRGHDDG